MTLALFGCAHAPTPKLEMCESSSRLQDERSAELFRIEKEDQADRQGPFDSINWSKVAPRDLQRRVRVAQIFAEGCFKNASDYASAAMVFQHGETADHFFQAFLWAREAVKRGDESLRSLVAAALDRYLVQIGQKQLFGTQFFSNDGRKLCIQPVESTFPDSQRIKYVRFNLKEEIKASLKAFGAKQTPKETQECSSGLKPSPHGTVPGFW